MKNNLPILTAAFGSLVSASLAFAQSPPLPQSPQNGQQLIHGAARTLFQGPPLEAEISQRTMLLGQELTASGSYRQRGQSTSMVRLDMSFAADGEVFGSFQQLCDGSRCYLRREVHNDKSISYIDIKRVRQAITAAGDDAPPMVASNWMSVGGLPMLLEQMSKHFEFSQPRAEHLGSARIPVLVVRGKWKPRSLARLLSMDREDVDSDDAELLKKLPPQVPHEVEITLGNDEQFPLFPYRIVYYRRTDDGTQRDASSDGLTPIITLKLFKVRRVELDAGQFDPGLQENSDDDIDLTDETASYLKKLGLVKEK